MKTILTASILHMALTGFSFANGGLTPEKQEEVKRGGTPKVDDIYLDELQVREAALKREERSRSKMEENPRNRAFVESFGQIDSKEDDQEREEEDEVLERQNARESEPSGAEQSKKRIWR